MTNVSFHLVLVLINRSTFADIEIGIIAQTSPVLNELFKRYPIISIEVSNLRRHIAHVESLLIGFGREETVV